MTERKTIYLDDAMLKVAKVDKNKYADMSDFHDACVDCLKSLPSAQPERPEQPESAKEYCAECDHIEMCRWYPYEGCEFRSLPSAQPERKKGEWILTEDDNYEYCTCSECGYQNGENWMNGSDIPFCAVCGADMRGEQDDSISD